MFKRCFSSALFLEFITLLSLIVAGLKLTWGLSLGTDIALYDESDYLNSGAKLLLVGLPQASFSPLYAIWYFLLSLFAENKIHLYYLNYYLMVILLPLATYLFLRVKSISRPISLTVASWVLLLADNLRDIQKVYHFATILILLNLSLLHYIKNKRLFFAINSLSSLLISWVRPEFFIAFIFSSIALAMEVFDRWKRTRQLEAAPLLLYLLSSSILLPLFGFPLAGNRSTIAFGQHFALHWVFWVQADMSPWTNWETIVAQNFGPNINNVKDAFSSNPVLFFKHIANNITDLTIIPTLLRPLVIPDDRFSKFIFYTSVFAIALSRIRDLPSNRIFHKDLLLATGFFAIPCLISILIINPREHYLLAIMVLGIAIATLLLTPHRPWKSRERNLELRYLSFLIALLLILTPVPYLRVDRAHFPRLNTIVFLQSLKIQAPVQLLEAEGGYHIYAGDNYRRVAEYDKKVDFDRFLQLKGINAIVVSEGLNRDTRFRNDPQWHRFLANPEAAGFKQLAIPNTSQTLLVKSELLPEANP